MGGKHRDMISCRYRLIYLVSLPFFIVRCFFMFNSVRPVTSFAGIQPKKYTISSWKSRILVRMSSNDDPDEQYGDEKKNENDLEWDMDVLSKRIDDLEGKSQSFEEGLLRRVRLLSKANAIEEQLLLLESTQDLPVICFDALLPKQRLKGSTQDVTFGNFLTSLGLGGIFVMVSLNFKQRKLRRSGVLTRIELVDFDEKDPNSVGLEPTAVDFSLVGIARCRIAGPAKSMKARVGRWRRSYDDYGEQSVLGWGMETFCDFDPSHQVEFEKLYIDNEQMKLSSVKKWNSNCITDIDVNHEEGEDFYQNRAELETKAAIVDGLLDKWLELASNVETYKNLGVVATSRIAKGASQLSCDPSQLLKNVLRDLGPRPPRSQPTALCFWGAALINPLPPLGVSLEIRGNLLEATTTEKRLNILEQGLKRSIANLDGSCPL